MPEFLDKFSDATVYFVLASVSSIVFLVRLVMAMFGQDSADADGTPAGDVGGDSGSAGDSGGHTDSTAVFKLFSLLSILAFFMGAGWMGLAARVDWDLPGPISVLLAVLFGLAMMLLSSGLAYMTRRLSSTPRHDPSTTIGGVGQVYLTIPARGAGSGQVQLDIQGKRRVMSAVSTGPGIEAFRPITVVRVESDGTLVVEPRA